MDLKDPVTELRFVGEAYARKLAKLGIETVEDLLLHVPSRYIDFSKTVNIFQAKVGETVTIKGEITSVINQKTKRGIRMQMANVTDETGEISAVWFNQPYLLSTLKKSVRIALAGKVDWFGRKKAIFTPEYEIDKGIAMHTGRLLPIYPQTAGVSSKWLRRRIKEAHDQCSDTLQQTLTSSDLQRLGMISLPKAIKQVHFPASLDETKKGRERLAFEELLRVQLRSLIRKEKWGKNKLTRTITPSNKFDIFYKRLPFELTKSQTRSIKEILSDLYDTKPMNRLLEGDVGSGKTVVAAAAAFEVMQSGHSAVFMAPTQILAEQHFITLKQIFDDSVGISLLTSGKTIENPRSDIIVGTHALLFKKNFPAKVALVVVDEQQRFGVRQRGELVKIVSGNGAVPHILTMTATPIPRTVALSAYGDLDLSTLDELPKPKKVKTWLVPKKKRESGYRWIEKQINEKGVQAYVVCPLIDESEAKLLAQVKSAKAEFAKLKEVLPNLSIGLLHGKLKAKEKERVLNKFRSESIDILVTTPVIEVGIDIPNASIMLIETADRFGLAQLHQLRGRIGRDGKEAYCLLFSESQSLKAQERLSTLRKTLSGFELSELDLKMRGPGEVYGVAQHGFPELRVASWQDIELTKIARKHAEEIISQKNKYEALLSAVRSGKTPLN